MLSSEAAGRVEAAYIHSVKTFNLTGLSTPLAAAAVWPRAMSVAVARERAIMAGYVA